MKKTLLSWSSGKDSAWALHQLRQQPDIELAGLFCTVNQAYERVAMHAVRMELLQRQARAAGLALQIIPIPNPCSNADYKRIMREFIEQVAMQDIDCMAFGDLFLEEVRRYREDNLTDTGITPIFPLWGQETKRLSEEMIESGLRATITCVDPKHLPAEFSGREYNALLLQQLPNHIDPCGENGEFHTFAFAGPMFDQPIEHGVGETVTRDGFVFTDLLPA